MVQKLYIWWTPGNLNQLNTLPVVSGIPQGSILGPLLFTIYVSDIQSVTQSCSSEFYIDNAKLHLSFTVHNHQKCHKQHIHSRFFLVLTKPDQGTTTVTMDKTDEVQERQIFLNDAQSYKSIEHLMVKNTLDKTKRLITELYHAKFIDEMTYKWLSRTQNPFEYILLMGTSFYITVEVTQNARISHE